jgi:prolyl 4-hydroxylase
MSSVETELIHNMQLSVIDCLLSEKECSELIEHFDSQKSEYVNRGIAEYHRHQEINKELVTKLLQRIKLPENYNGSKIVGLNDHFRFSKYEPGMQFSIHRDGTNQDSRGNRSVMTLNIFLNDNFEGGSTDFYYNDHTLAKSVVPKVGRAALFDSQIYHSGILVTSGYKYLLRTDVMTSL